MNTLNIYIITSEHLKLRHNYLNNQLEKLKKILDEVNIKFVFNQISEPSHKNIEENIINYKDKVNMNKDNINDDDFKSMINIINSSQLSNIYKHIEAYNKIKNSNSNFNFIIEDDLLIIDDYINNFKKLLENIKKIEYDLVFSCLSINNENTNKYEFIKTTDNFKILLSKSSYFISKDTAINLIDYLKVVSFNLKLSISKYIWDNKDTIKSYVFNKHTLFEGSKVGLFPTSINTNNFLYQNNDYVSLSKLIGNEDYLNDSVVKVAEEIYNKSGKNNPDFEHSLGIIYYKNKSYDKAKEILKSAVFNLKKMEGLLSPYNEILNNCINMHQYDQKDIELTLKTPGIYS